MSATDSPGTEDLAAAIYQGRSRWRTWLRYSLILLVLGGGGAGYYFWHKKNQKENQPEPYVTEAIEKGDIGLTVTVTGKLQPTNEVTVGSELSGLIVEVYVDTNDHVSKGQAMAKLDTTKLNRQLESSRASVNSAKARVAQTEATVKESEAKLARLQELHRVSGGKIPSRLDMDTSIATADRAKADLLSAKAAVETAEAQVRILETDLSRSVIKSPIDGVVLTRSIEPGQTVAASFTAPTLFVIAEKLEHMLLKVAIAEADIARLDEGQRASFMVDAWPGRVYDAKVRKVSAGSAIVDNVVTYETELEVVNNDLSLRPGMTATADIHVAESKDVFLVPVAALRFDPNDTPQFAQAGPGKEEKKSFMQSIMPSRPPRWSSGARRTQKSKKSGEAPRIWVLKDGRPEALVVKTGLADGKRMEVSGEGVREDMMVITRANSPAS